MSRLAPQKPDESAKSITENAGRVLPIGADVQEGSVSTWCVDALWRSLLMGLPETLWVDNPTALAGSEQQSLASSCFTVR